MLYNWSDDPIWAVQCTQDKFFQSYTSKIILTDTGENVQKWTRVFSTRRWVILVARTRRKKRRKILASTIGRFRLWTSFESSPVSVKTSLLKIIYQKLNKNLVFQIDIYKTFGKCPESTTGYENSTDFQCYKGQLGTYFSSTDRKTNVTISGKICQNWDENYPHEVKSSPINDTTNFCSDHDVDQQVWKIRVAITCEFALSIVTIRCIRRSVVEVVII